MVEDEEDGTSYLLSSVSPVLAPVNRRLSGSTKNMTALGRSGGLKPALAVSSLLRGLPLSDSPSACQSGQWSCFFWNLVKV